MAQARLQYLSEDEKGFVLEQVLELLSAVGVAYNTPAALDLLEQAGAQVDREALTARLTWDVIEPALKTAPRTVLLAGRRREDDRVLGEWPLVVTSDGMTTYMQNDRTGERAAGTLADLVTVTRLCDAMPNLDTLWPSPQTSDADPFLMPLQMQATMVRNSSKHVQDEVRTPELVEPILAIYEAAAGASLRERPYFSVTNCTIAPLMHDRAMTEASLKLCKRGVPIFVHPIVQAGTTGPITLLGSVIVTIAEAISGIVLFQLANPGCATICSIGSAVADMATGGFLSAGPEIGLINTMCIEMGKHLGLPTQATGISTDAKAANFQAGSEGGMTGLMTALAGADSLIAHGALDSVQNSSLAKIVLDDDQVAALRRYIRPGTIDATAALMDDIREVGIGGHFLGRKSTRALARSEVWRPQVFQRGPYETYAAPDSLVEDALERARELLASHQVEPLADEAEREIDRVIAGFSAKR